MQCWGTEVAATEPVGDQEQGDGAGLTEPRSCVKVEVAVLGSPPSLIVLLVSVDVKQH